MQNDRKLIMDDLFREGAFENVFLDNLDICIMVSDQELNKQIFAKSLTFITGEIWP